MYLEFLISRIMWYYLECLPRMFHLRRISQNQANLLNDYIVEIPLHVACSLPARIWCTEGHSFEPAQPALVFFLSKMSRLWSITNRISRIEMKARTLYRNPSPSFLICLCSARERRRPTATCYILLHGEHTRHSAHSVLESVRAPSP